VNRDRKKVVRGRTKQLFHASLLHVASGGITIGLMQPSSLLEKM
jgi:hypothetical protein